MAETQLPRSTSQEHSKKHDGYNVHHVKKSFIPYRVNYNWNRGGRLKELRIRHLARKFLHLWMCEAFGRVLPSKARSHYRCALLNKVFNEWKEQWWCARIEWKLTVRADCHCRYYMYNQTWRAWQKYILQQQKKKSKYRIAASHAHLQTLHMIWTHWSLYIKIRNTKHLMQIEAKVFHIKTITRNVWSIWTKQLVRKERNRAMDGLAMQYWAETLQHRAWLQWKVMLHQSINVQERVAEAQQTYQRRCLSHSFLAWLVYVQVRREKKSQHSVADQMYTNTVLSQYFASWFLSWHHQKNIHILETRISELSRRCKLRRSFQHWSHYIVLRAEKTGLCKLADGHYRCYLAQSSIVALKNNVGNVRLKQMQNNLAHQQSVIWMLQRCWNQWKLRLEKQEEFELQALSREAQNHFRKVLLKKSLHYWIKHSQETKYYQIQDKKAKAHCSRMLLPFYLERWKLYVSEKKQLNQMKETAWLFHREKLQRLSFYLWWRMMDHHRENRLAERLAVIHSDQRMLLHYWCCWHVRTTDCLEEREQEATAEDFFRHQLLLKFIRFWRKSAADQKAGRDKEIQAIRHRYKFCLLRTWSAWQQYVQKKQENWKKQLCADVHFHRVLLCKALNGWKVYHQITRQILYKVDEKEKKWKFNLLRIYFSTWLQNTRVLADEARKTVGADYHYHHVLLTKVLGYWRARISIQVYHRQQKDKVVLEAKQHISLVHLQHVFSHWKRLSQGAMTQRGKLEAASQHYTRQIAKKYLLSWKQYRDHCLRVMLLHRQEQWFQSYRLCRFHFTDWKAKLLEKRQEDKQTATALWHWSLLLQGKVFDGWLMHAQEQQRKKLRIAKAADNYRGQLLRMGVAAVLQYSSDMMQFRNQIAAEHQVKTAYSLHQVVYRCAMIWKQRVLCKSEKLKQRSAAVTRKKNVAFKFPVTDVCKEKDASTKTGILNSASQKMIAKPATDPVQCLNFSAVLPGSDMDFTNLHLARQARLQPRKPKFLLKPPEKKELLDRGNNGDNALILGSSLSTLTSLSEDKVETPTQSKVHEVRTHTSQRNNSMKDTVDHVTWQPQAATLQAVQSQMTLPFTHFVPSWPTMDTLQEQPVRKDVLLPPSAFLSLGKERGNTNEDEYRNNGFGAHQVQKDKRVLPKHTTRQLLSPDHLRDRTEFLSPSFQEKDADFAECDQQRKLKAELHGIRQQMQSFHDSKQQLRIWQKQASVLQNWLQVNATEDGEAPQMRQELKQLEIDIKTLSMKLKRDTPHIQHQVARVQEIREILTV
ncbi:protein SFI1 homolog isoform X2 [Leucoraja erinacea]|nr:protein SFI1 homolog isoform X2 [Leucoraja erinacea]